MTRTILTAVLLLSFLLVPAGVSADDNIRLIDSSTKIDFPNLLVFSVKADSSQPITRVRLRYEVDKITYAPSFAEAWPDFQPGKSISASWSWDMRKGSMPPGALITYWWVIQDSGGNRLTTKKETVRFDDTRYKWQQVSDQMITIYWYQGSKSFAEQILKAAVEAKTTQEKDTGVILEKPVSFYIYANYRDLRGSIVAPEEWTGGVAYAGFNIISIGISTNNLDWGKTAVAHELGHLITHQVTYSPYGSNIPPWLDEGLAMHAEGKQSEADRKVLRAALNKGKLATLKSLSSPFPADPEGAYYAYAQSQSVIEYMTSSFARNKIGELLRQLNDGTSIDDALLNIYGFDMDGLDQQWTDWLMSQTENKSETKSGSVPLTGASCTHPVYATTAG